MFNWPYDHIILPWLANINEPIAQFVQKHFWIQNAFLIYVLLEWLCIGFYRQTGKLVYAIPFFLVVGFLLLTGCMWYEECLVPIFMLGFVIPLIIAGIGDDLVG